VRQIDLVRIFVEVPWLIWNIIKVQFAIKHPSVQ